MQKFYTIIIMVSSLFAFNSCSKDILKSYEDRIIGTWELEEVNRVGFGGDVDDLPIKEGSVFIFNENGGLIFNDINGDVYTGSWDIERIYTSDQQIRSLHISAVNFSTQQMRSELFEDIHFTRTNKFKAFIRQGLHTFVFHFER